MKWEEASSGHWALTTELNPSPAGLLMTMEQSQNRTKKSRLSAAVTFMILHRESESVWV